MCSVSYKDITFCQESTCARFGKNCSRSLTPEMEDAAKRWWGSDDAPISVFTGRPDCYVASLGEEICREPVDKRKPVV
jgi:hypothetical protein